MTARHISWTAALATAITLTAACGGRGKGSGKGDLQVTSHSPAAARIDLAEPIQIQFDKPVAGEDEVGHPLAAVPVTIEPSVPLAAQWADRQTLVVTPTGELAPSTRYRVELTGPLAARSGGFTFEFVNHPLEVDGVWGMQIDRLPPHPTLPLHFNQPVRAGDVIQKCRVAGEAGAIPGLLTVADQDAVADVIEVEPAVALTQGVDYRLTCDGLAGAGGDEPMTEAFSQLLHTYPTLSIAKVGPGGYDVPADDVEIEITLSTPVDLETLRKHLEAKPAIRGLARGALDADGTRYRAIVSLEVETPYQIRVTKGLTDVFGQTLDAPVTHDFTTGSARPRLSLETGIFAVEPTAGGYPVWSRSVSTFAVQCAAVPKASIVKVLTSEMDYDPWYDASSPDVVKWKQLGMNAKKKKIAITDAKNNWHLEKVVMHETCGGAPRGLFLADFSSPDILMDPDRSWSYRPSRRVLANVTDLGVLLKAGPASGLVWVTSIATGKPVASAQVQVYAPTGKQVWSGTTDKDGLAMLPGSAKLLGDKPAGEPAGEGGEGEGDEMEGWDSYRAQRLIAIVEKGDDLAAVDGNWANGIQTWNFGVPEDRGGGQTRVRGLIQSDRGIYRPGETVHFKGIAREIAIGRAASVPAGAPVDVTVSDSRGATLLEKKLPLTRFGGFSFDLPIAEEAPTGDYQVTATLKKQVFRESFQVEEFRKVTFEVDVASPARHGSLGEKLLFNVSADFLFGAPVKEAKVTWEVQRRPHHLHFPRYPEYGFVDYAARGAYSWWYYDEESASEYTSFVSDGETRTDARGKAAFAVRDPKSEFDGPQDYLARAVVTDESDQSVGKQVVVTAHPSEFYVGLHTQEFVQAVDMPFAVNTIALRPDGAQVGTKATMTFVRESWDCSWSEGARSYQSCTDKHDTEWTREITIPATGNGTERILPKKPGEYVIRVEATDPRGAKVTSSSYVWVLGKGEAFWSGDEDARMSLIASKPEYKAGETAKIVPRTGLTSPTALVTLERNGVLSARVLQLESASQGIEVPLTGAHAPNVFASVAMVSGRTGEGDRHRPRFKMGVIDLVVSSEENRLDVAIETERDKYQPGETVNGVVRLRSKGQPVVGEVALSVADEGVLQLIAYKTPDPMKTFFASWGLGVDAGTNWNRIARLNDPTSDDPEEGGDSGSAPEGRIRSKFLSSAFWAPHLVTDEHGEVKFSFPAPDNLTAWRLMAVAADEGTRFGSGELRVTVAKPLLVKPVLPRFVGAGDKVEVGLVVHNYTGKAGTATVTAKATGASLGQETQTVELADGASARVRFSAAVKQRAAATFELAAAMGEHRDALVMDVPVERGLVLDKRTLARGAVGGEGVPSSAQAELTWDKAVLPADSMLTVTVDRTGLGELEPSLRYLIEYPYGCLEQTLSRTIPMAKVKDLARSLEMAELDGPALKKYLRIGVAKVARHQHADGHFSLWPNSEPYPHLTVYALYGLNEAKRAGVEVDERAVADGLAAMKRWATDGGRVLGANAESGTVAMAAYLMAELGSPDAGLNARLFEVRGAIPRYGEAFLLMAMARAKAPAEQIATLKDEILTQLAADGESVIVHESIDMHHEMGSDVRSTAMMMSALLMVAPDHPVVEKLAEGLKKEQLPSGHWRNTQDNLFGLVALADYARTRSKGSAVVVVKLGDKKLVTKTVSGGKPVVLRRALSGLQPGTITVESQGRALYAVRVTEARQDPATAPVEAGFTITREYLDPETEEPVTSPKANQLVRVKLTIKTSEQRHYVAVRDRLPAGLEPVNSRLATESGDAAPDSDGDPRWWRQTWVYTDLRDEGATAFADVLPAGEHVFEYNARATIPGTFRVLPAEVEAMYEPELRGRTTGAQMVVRR